MFNKILNPETGRWVYINGNTGKQILKNYITRQIGGFDKIRKESSKWSESWDNDDVYKMVRSYIEDNLMIDIQHKQDAVTQAKRNVPSKPNFTAKTAKKSKYKSAILQWQKARTELDDAENAALAELESRENEFQSVWSDYNMDNITAEEFYEVLIDMINVDVITQLLYELGTFISDKKNNELQAFALIQ